MYTCVLSVCHSMCSVYVACACVLHVYVCVWVTCVFRWMRAYNKFLQLLMCACLLAHRSTSCLCQPVTKYAGWLLRAVADYVFWRDNLSVWALITVPYPCHLLLRVSRHQQFVNCWKNQFPLQQELLYHLIQTITFESQVRAITRYMDQ